MFRLLCFLLILPVVFSQPQPNSFVTECIEYTCEFDDPLTIIKSNAEEINCGSDCSLTVCCDTTCSSMLYKSNDFYEDCSNGFKKNPASTVADDSNFKDICCHSPISDTSDKKFPVQVFSFSVERDRVYVVSNNQPKQNQFIVLYDPSGGTHSFQISAVESGDTITSSSRRKRAASGYTLTFAYPVPATVEAGPAMIAETKTEAESFDAIMDDYGSGDAPLPPSPPSPRTTFQRLTSKNNRQSTTGTIIGFSAVGLVFISMLCLFV